MKLFIDCEWNSEGGQLISMALVPGDRRRPDFKQELELREEIHPWVRENVLPHLNQYPVDWHGFQSNLESYLSLFESVHIIADWPEDIGRFCGAMITGPGTRIDTPPITFEILRCDPVSDIPHDALADARALRAWYFAEMACVL